MNEQVLNKISHYAQLALLYEVTATPKPGLVDTKGPGAHEDMDVFTFLDSASVLGPYFLACAHVGASDFPNHQVLEKLKPLGLKAESHMYDVTGGVNTHKGVIYALGLLTAATAQVSLLASHDDQDFFTLIGDRVVAYVTVEKTQLPTIMQEADTYGGKQYMKYGLLGARGAALSGYHMARTVGFQSLVEATDQFGLAFNEAMLVTLLRLMTCVEDSNVMGRHNPEMLRKSQAFALEILEKDHFMTDEGKALYDAYCQWSLSHNVSHGGAADLLSVSLFFWFLKKKGL